jgi:hypothetical protein
VAAAVIDVIAVRKDKIGRQVLEIRGRNHSHGIARKKPRNTTSVSTASSDRLAVTQQPAGDHQDQRIVDQVGTAQTAVDRRHHRGTSQ